LKAFDREDNRTVETNTITRHRSIVPIALKTEITFTAKRIVITMSHKK
jgi:hypothetical protein